MDANQTGRMRKRRSQTLKGWAGAVLAAGKGVRMRSRTPKVLHQVCGKAMLLYPVDALKQVGIEHPLVVVSSQNRKGVKALLEDSVEYVLQKSPLGTGHALQQAVSQLKGVVEHLLVTGADSPLVKLSSLADLISLHLESEASVTLLTAPMTNNTDMGSVVRDSDGRVVAVVEASFSEASTNGTTEVNSGVYCFRRSWLHENLGLISPSANGEQYITSLIALAASQNTPVEALQLPDPEEVLGINNRLQQAQAEKALRQRILNHWMLQGVAMLDPATTIIDTTVEIGQDTVIYPNTLILGHSKIGAQCTLGPGALIQDSTIGEGCKIVASILEGAILEQQVDIGPFSHLRLGAYLERGVRIGNFSEIKSSRLGQSTVMGHFGYVGNASIGAHVNLGAGMITCNYDGVTKQRTVVEDNAFIGSDTMLVAPVTVGEGAITAAGSVITRDVPSHRLAVGVPARIKSKGGKKNPRS